MGIARRLTHHIQRRTLTLCNLADMLDMLLVDQQSHALLALVSNDLLARERLVADGQLGHVNLTATLLNELRQTVQVTS